MRIRERSAVGGAGLSTNASAVAASSKPGQVARATVAGREVLLEAGALVSVQHIECVEGGKLVKVVGHIDPNPYSPASPGRFVIPVGSFWTLCAVGVLVDERVHDIHALAVGCVDADERLPFVGQGVLGEDRLDRALRLARAAVDALLRVDHEDAAGLVDAVDGADVDAGAVLDVDARLGDDVRHGGLLYRRKKTVDQLARALEERRFRHHLVETGCVRAPQAGGVRVVRVAENRHVRVAVGDVDGVDARDVGDHEIGRLDSVRRLEAMLRQERLRACPG